MGAREVALRTMKTPLSFWLSAATAICLLWSGDSFAQETATIPFKDLPSLVKAVSPSVVSVHVERNDGSKSQGTGFFVQANGVVVTNYHVVVGATRINAVMKGGANLFCTGILTLDETRDLALLKFSGKNLPSLDLAQEEAITVGETIAVIGSPKGLEQTVTSGIVSAVRSDEDWEKIQISAPVSPGSSGSPVVNMRGEIVGVATFFVSGQSLNFASSVKHLRPLVASLDYLEQTPLAISLGVTRREPRAMVPVEPVVQPTIDPKADALEAFWQSYWNSMDLNQKGAWASHFSEVVDYQYKKDGKASRQEVGQSSFELQEKYPTRRYRLRGQPKIIELNKENTRIGFDFVFDYEYFGPMKNAAGTSSVELALEWNGSIWQIYKFRESVSRR